MNPIQLAADMRKPEFQKQMLDDIRKAVEYTEEEYKTLSAVYMIGYGRGRMKQ